MVEAVDLVKQATEMRRQAAAFRSGITDLELLVTVLRGSARGKAKDSIGMLKLRADRLVDLAVEHEDALKGVR